MLFRLRAAMPPGKPPDDREPLLDLQNFVLSPSLTLSHRAHRERAGVRGSKASTKVFDLIPLILTSRREKGLPDLLKWFLYDIEHVRIYAFRRLRSEKWPLSGQFVVPQHRQFFVDVVSVSA